MKLYFIIFSCIGITLYCAEKKLNADKIIREWQNGGSIDLETLHKLMRQQAAVLKEQDLSFFKASYFATKRPVPERIIERVDAQTAELARAHNKNLQQQLLQNQRK